MSIVYNEIKLESLTDVVNYKVSHEAQVPSKGDLNTEGILKMMDEDPDSFIYVDMLGSTYTIYHRKDEEGRVGIPQVVMVEGHHFMHILKRCYWAFAEEYLWDLYDAARYEMDGYQSE